MGGVVIGEGGIFGLKADFDSPKFAGFLIVVGKFDVKFSLLGRVG